MIRKAIYLSGAAICILIIALFLQPLKKGQGPDKKTKYLLNKGWPALNWGAINSVELTPSGLYLLASDDVSFLKIWHRGSDILVFDTAGNVQARIGRTGSYKGPATWYHDLAADQEGNIYVGDLLGNAIQKFKKSERIPINF
jgi:hypothetical protein